MFNTIFGSSTLEDLDHRKWLFTDAVNQNIDRVQSRADKYRLNLNNFSDDCGQNLLHISVRNGNYDFTKKLIVRGVDSLKINSIGETPLDIAVQRNDVPLIKLILHEDTQVYKDEVKYIKRENQQLKEKNEEYDKSYKQLLHTSDDLTKKWNTVATKLDIEIIGRKRLRDEIDECKRDNKRIKLENDQLKNDNKILQDTINVLRSKHKK